MKTPHFKFVISGEALFSFPDPENPPHALRPVLVRASLKKLSSHYFGRKGEGYEWQDTYDFSRYSNIKKIIDDGQDVWAPVIKMNPHNDGFVILAGRHKFLYLHDQGFDNIDIAVPPQDVDRVNRFYGV